MAHRSQNNIWVLKKSRRSWSAMEEPRRRSMMARMPRAAIGLIFAVTRYSSGLTQILLWKSDDPRGVGGQAAVESLDDQHLLLTEVVHPTGGNRNAVFTEDLCAQPLVLDRLREIYAASAGAERKLHNVGSWGRAQGPHPFSLAPEECGLLLSSGQGDSELLVWVAAGKGWAQ